MFSFRLTLQPMEDPLDMIMAEKEVEPELLTYGMHTSNPDPRVQGLISYWTNKGNTKIFEYKEIWK